MKSVNDTARNFIFRMGDTFEFDVMERILEGLEGGKEMSPTCIICGKQGYNRCSRYKQFTVHCPVRTVQYSVLYTVQYSVMYTYCTLQFIK